MSPRSFAVLLLVTVASVALATAAVLERDLPVGSAGLEAPLVPQLVERLDDVASVAVTAKGQTMTATRTDRGWVLEEKGGYPVDPAKVRDLVLAVASARLVEAKTADAERLGRLELDDPADEQSRAKAVRIAGADGGTLAEIVVGKTRYGLYGAGRGGAYVRHGEDSQAWLADRTIQVPEQPLDWLDRRVVDLSGERLAEVTIGIDRPEPVRIARAEPGAEAFTLVGTPEGRQPDPEKIERVTGLLAGLTLQDVRAARDMPPGVPLGTAEFVTRTGTSILVHVQQEGHGEEAAYWARVEVAEGSADGTSTTAAADPTAEAAAPEPDTNDGLGEADRWRLEGWAFKLPKYVADRFAWTVEDLLAPADGTS
jgi:Domain of unknown function (DUF4340)